jgi:hypothetical protein
MLTLSAGFLLTREVKALSADAPHLAVQLGSKAAVSLPSNFTGLGYEMSSVAPIGLLSATNERYVALVKGLGSKGVIRVGGIVADYTRYEPDGTIVAERQNTVITRQSLEQFAAFLARIGWTAIWSVNFAQGTIQDAVEEARAVHSILGDQLLALEIGNEVENYYRGPKPFRKAPYGYEAYLKEFNDWRAAILKAVPGIRFAAPDTASSVEWVERMAADAKGEVQLLTTHYYRNNQRRGSAEQLLKQDPRLADTLSHLRTASQQSGIPWRMCETNSFSGGGRPGVSDTFVGALWTLDFMLLLAQSGCSGVNIETGVNQLGFVSSYSPIQDNSKGLNTAGVPYYGMLAFAQARDGCDQLLDTEFDPAGRNVTAYVLGKTGKPLSAVIINRDTQDVNVSVRDLRAPRLIAIRMSAPSADANVGVMLGAATVDSDGHWIAKGREQVRNAVLKVPQMSAVILRSIH